MPGAIFKLPENIKAKKGSSVGSPFLLANRELWFSSTNLTNRATTQIMSLGTEDTIFVVRIICVFVIV
jgi:hypothetical protein